jgi:hypothetical protein
MLLEAGVAFDPKAVDTARAAGHGKLADALEAWRCSQMEKQELAMSTGDGVARSLGAKRV